ncbi:MAG: carotenoid oxygenase family protein [Pseudomonadota bacterium]|nr:carotenoid oxygenase family protein [Pseudomonadota bacterium]
MNRRHFLHGLAAVGAAASHPVFARSPEGEAFDDAVKATPWLTPFKGVSDATQDLHCNALALSGRWPDGLRGRFYRNGPALFERDGQRYHHWFAGDGMVQQFSFSGGARPAVRHLGRLVRTPKYLAEQHAGKFLVPAYGTHVASESPAGGPDAFNVANTNAIEHAGRLLALWEGGSAFALDPRDLSTLGPVTWRPGLEQMPFSAHPKVDADGHLWNFGSSGDKLVVWHVDPQGSLVRAQVGDSPYPGGMAHDAAVTAQHIVLPLPPIKLRFGEDVARAFDYQPNEPLRLLVMRKDDIAQRRVFELPAQMVFHVGNAWDRPDGGIMLSYIGSETPEFAVRGAQRLVAGHPAASAGSSTRIAHLDMRSGQVRAESLGDCVEFPRMHPQRIGQQARYLLSATASCASMDGLFHGVQMRDLDTGRVARHDYGEDTIAEEHIVVPKPGGTRELDAWLLGTTFDVRRQVTRINVLDARHLDDGPIAQATLPYLLPYGFHGNFTAA